VKDRQNAHRRERKGKKNAIGNRVGKSIESGRTDTFCVGDDEFPDERRWAVNEKDKASLGKETGAVTIESAGKECRTASQGGKKKR